MKLLRRFVCVCTAAIVLGCPSGSRAWLFGPSGDDLAQKRANILSQSQSMTAQLVAFNPALSAALKNAVGYATFTQMNVNLLLVSTANGYGVVVNNQTGAQTFMRMASLGTGFGAGIRDLRVIFIFNDANVMQQFVNQGWQFGGQADATAKYQDSGIAAGQSATGAVNYQDGAVSGGTTTDVTAQAGRQNSAGANVATPGGMQIYQFTESGVALQATVAGTKYWKDANLNQ